jgi:DNA-binding LacI/PurR family transcriptional regulator
MSGDRDGRTSGPWTIRDVARDAGVSVATVSRVLAGSASVSGALAVRVRESVRRLGYTPHTVARSLASGRTRLVGALVPNLANHYFYTLLKRLLHDAERDGYRLIVADSDEDVGAERELALNLLAQTDGLILCSPRVPANVLRQYLARGKPVLVLNRAVDTVPVSQVMVESYPAMRQIAAHVAQLGHHRVLYLQGPLRSWQSKERWRAVRSLARQGLDLTAVRVGATMSAGHEAVPRVLDSGATAVLAYNDLVAIGLVVGLAERGVRVPEDLSVTGYDDITYSRYVTPPLTTVRSPQDEVGSVAWKLMDGLLHGDPPGARTVLAAEPVIRRSTAPPGRER